MTTGMYSLLAFTDMAAIVTIIIAGKLGFLFLGREEEKEWEGMERQGRKRVGEKEKWESGRGRHGERERERKRERER